MKQFEFETFIGDDETVKIPSEFATQIERNFPVRVLVLVPDCAKQEQRTELTVEQFLQGYADSDAIYDDVSVG